MAQLVGCQLLASLILASCGEDVAGMLLRLIGEHLINAPQISEKGPDGEAAIGNNCGALLRGV